MSNNQKNISEMTDVNNGISQNNNSYLIKVALQKVALFKKKVINGEITPAQALESMSALVNQTNNSMVVIGAMMTTESLVVSKEGTNISLVKPASYVYENALKRSSENNDVIEVANDSIRNIIQNTNNKEVTIAESYMANSREILTQLVERNNNRANTIDAQVTANSGNCAQTKYGVVNPQEMLVNVEIPANSGNYAQTKYGVINPQTDTRLGHVLFQTPSHEFIIAPKNRIPEKYIDKDGQFAEAKTSESFTLSSEPQIVKSNEIGVSKDLSKTSLISEMLNQQGRNE